MYKRPSKFRRWAERHREPLHLAGFVLVVIIGQAIVSYIELK